METLKTLSGEELVSRGVTTIFATLPEIGLKDVLPNGSWLEAKQIQAALDARKNLIDVERIEKFGTLSQAEWRDDLRLAEVTRHTGSHWQFFGHNIGKKMYLRCEEALFLMEVNCLQLKHNEVTVSLQKAYSLLLDDTFTINQYKVYASLSRLGYKVYRHKGIKHRTFSKKQFQTPIGVMRMESDPSMADLPSTSSDTVDKTIGDKIQNDNTVKVQTNDVDVKASIKAENGNMEGTAMNITKYERDEVSSTVTDDALPQVNTSDIEQCGSSNNILNNNNSGEQNTNAAGVSAGQDCVEEMDVSQDNNITNITAYVNSNSKIIQTEQKIQKLLNRQLKPTRDFHKFFEEIPEMDKTDIAYINTPEDYYIPKNIYVNKTTYTLNLKRIRSKAQTASSDEAEYSSSGDDDQSLRMIRNSSRNSSPQMNTSPYYPQMRLPRINQQFRPFLLWSARPHFNFNHFNSFYPRPLMHQFHHRYPFHVRPSQFLRPYSNVNILAQNNIRNNSLPRPTKRQVNSRYYHYRTIKMLATRVKNSILTGNLLPGQSHFQAIQVLHRLLYSYNTKFNASIRLNTQFELVNGPSVVETIELDDPVQRKRPRLVHDTFNANLNKLKQLAAKLKAFEDKGVSTSRQRRAFSNAVKQFNNSYNADVYLNDNHELIDRRHITLDTSSDSESGANNNKKSRRQLKKKRLRNPFHVLKHLSNGNNDSECPASTSKKDTSKPHAIKNKTTISENWSPNANDFGKMEICPWSDQNSCIISSYEENILFDFLKSQSRTYRNWIEAKTAFLKYANKLHKQYLIEQSNGHTMSPENQLELRSIIRPGDCSDMPSMMDKLRIIKTDKNFKTQSNIVIHFDVYHRDVQNFRKSNPPKPHFRIVCFDDSSKLPPGEQVASLNAKYEDGVDVVYAIVGLGSISYIQINTTDIPVYVPCNDRP